MKFECQVCGKPDPSVFSLSTAGKVPLCTTDVGPYINSQNCVSHTILPIAAIEFIDSVADAQLYEKRVEDIGRCEEVMEKWRVMEKEQFEGAVVMLKELEENAVETVRGEFQKCIQKLRNMHSTLASKVATAQSEFNKVKHTKNAVIGTAADLFLKLILETQPPPSFLSTSNSEVEKLLRRAVEASVTLPQIDVEQYFFGLSLQKESELEECSHCSRRCGLFHQCKSRLLCLECYERLIACCCYHTVAKCPDCYKLPLEIYQNRAMKKCSMCEMKMKINQVTHWCEDADFLLCEKCAQSNDHCQKCNEYLGSFLPSA